MTDPDRPALSRRRLLGTSAATVAAASVAAVAAPVGVFGASAASGKGETGATGFVDAVLNAFSRHRLVAIGESHNLQDHHDALGMLLADPRLRDVVDDVVVEFGNALYQPTVDRFTAGLPVANPDLRAVWRNTTQSPLGTWDAPVYEHVFRTIRAVNGPLLPRKQIRVLLGDPPVDWSRIATRDELFAYLTQRDAHAAALVRREVLAKNRRALMLYGVTHLLHAVPAQPPNLTSLIEQQAGERVYTIGTLVPMADDPGGLGERLARYPRRTAIPTSGTWLGDFNAGQVYPSAFRGPDGRPTNIMCGVPLSSVLDAGLYVGRPDELTMSRENPASYLDPVYWAELRRRNDIRGGIADLDSYQQERPVVHPPQVVPPALKCR